VTDSTFVRAALTELGIDATGLRAIGLAHAFQAQQEQMLPLWRKLRAAHAQTGLWPLLIGPDGDIGDWGSNLRVTFRANCPVV
jgi:hypothetical protein